MSILPDPVVRDTAGAQRNWTAIGRLLHESKGDPNGVVTASPGALCISTAGGAGATLWVKESGINTDTGWVAK